MPQGWSAEGRFGRRAPLELEVGSGKGLFLATAAAAQPERDFLGCEISLPYARAAAARLVESGLTNAAVICGDAQQLVAERFADGSLDAVHVYFPDPWWKRRHRKRRVMSAPFVAQIQRVLRPGGRLHFWTDVEEYYRATLKLLTGFPALRGPLPVAERTPEHDYDYRTHFERRVRLHGEAVYRAEFERGP